MRQHRWPTLSLLCSLAQQNSEGLRYVMVNGEFVVDDGRITLARPGRPLRGPGYKRRAETTSGK
jgi:hypothetical protein